ncbi:MAG: DUF420 domain-containing protein [Flammeovirgaceae bacterium]
MNSAVIDKNDKRYLPIIWVLSVAIPVVVALLLFKPPTGSLGDLDVSFLPSFNAILNTAAAVALIAGLIAIKNKRPELHRAFMMGAFTLSSIFLISYVIYHTQAPATKFGGEGTIRIIYFAILITHIVLAAVIVPLVLLSIYFAISGQLPRHKKIVKWTYPIWLYVAITGPVIYLMISPYYTH